MISVAMIVKNEVQTLEETVKSVAEIADEIVIGVDSKSSDGTAEIAKKLATKIVKINLTDELEAGHSIEGLDDWGFSRARNIVLENCNPVNWRIILDGHEIVKHPEKISEWVKKVSAAKGDGIEVPIHFEPDENGVPNILYFQIRLISPSVRYRNAIHNYPVVAVPHQIVDVAIEHRKKNQNVAAKTERDKQRSRANMESLSSNVKNNPKDSRSWFYLGMAHRENGHWQDAINSFLKYKKMNIVENNNKKIPLPMLLSVN
jgi:glycosyltransferase involved in cell wall biosynthesis